LYVWKHLQVELFKKVICAIAQELEGTRRRGRPRKGWRKEAEKDLQVLGVRRWRESW